MDPLSVAMLTITAGSAIVDAVTSEGIPSKIKKVMKMSRRSEDQLEKIEQGKESVAAVYTAKLGMATEQSGIDVSELMDALREKSDSQRFGGGFAEVKEISTGHNTDVMNLQRKASLSLSKELLNLAEEQSDRLNALDMAKFQLYTNMMQYKEQTMR